MGNNMEYRTIKEVAKMLRLSDRHIEVVGQENNYIVCQVSPVMEEEEYEDSKGKTRKRMIVAKSGLTIKIKNF